MTTASSSPSAPAPTGLRRCLGPVAVTAQAVATVGLTLTAVINIPQAARGAGRATWIAYAIALVAIVLVSENLVLFRHELQPDLLDSRQGTDDPARVSRSRHPVRYGVCDYAPGPDDGVRPDPRAGKDDAPCPDVHVVTDLYPHGVVVVEADRAMGDDETVPAEDHVVADVDNVVACVVDLAPALEVLPDHL